MAQGNAHTLAKTRQKNARVILERLRKEAVSNPDEPMTTLQMKAAQIFLRKSIPDLKAIEHSGEGGGPVQIAVVKFADSDTE